MPARKRLPKDLASVPPCRWCGRAEAPLVRWHFQLGLMEVAEDWQRLGAHCQYCGNFLCWLQRTPETEELAGNSFAG